MLIRHAFEIDAPDEVVWQVITDLAGYPGWNPFVVKCESTLVVGDPIFMRVRLFSFWAQPQKEEVLEFQPRERFCYGLTGDRLGALAASRCHRLRSLGPHKTSYVSHFELRGWLAPLVQLLLSRRLESGFRAMSDAIAGRAEALARDAESVSRLPV